MIRPHPAKNDFLNYSRLAFSLILFIAILSLFWVTAPCGVFAADSDGDGVEDSLDGCPLDFFKTAPGLSGCGNARALVAAGYAHSLGLKSDGTVWTWGLNEHGQLGLGDKTGRNEPEQATGLSDVVSLAGGRTFSIALNRECALGYDGVFDMEETLFILQSVAGLR
ncbi:Regulator of chromosome condensation (RCC1) repeat-containing protein [Desulfatibacillum alkenivorans DSM 16219]|jgi:hypothetical protein|uniref:Regulator of chromosome condensation (RCC1) repeat-containing protein n=1 Tax=Desulfatibacillum alkenivorans DSM 16219 TaxID=1121393 RepID=A0A1M6XSH0_9BACT|nr:RCC1 domain-containing protein [Desulfatibacillum alkenivorans]SHL08848.1 Regulator of chromosome condensation (RCC1) repeat-containing protein [Desulfatibacillum alkenivorans DSM 16219]